MANFAKLQILGQMAKRVNKSEIEFQPGVNLLIGPNGSGKSTILRILREHNYPAVESKITTNGQGTMYSFDFEKNNPRHQGALHREGPKFHHQLASMMSSHGETVKSIIALLKDPQAQGAVLLMDEPEQALDMQGLQELIELMKTSQADQIIVATHSPFLILEPNFHIIELVDGYRQEVSQAINHLNQKAVL